MEGEVLGVALALPAEEVRRAFADAAHVCPVPGTLQRVLDVFLKQKQVISLRHNLKEKNKQFSQLFL